ncbi:MAG TPA: CDP-alcohol phosphatidyltransferase family protein [Gemmatimonadales bacterium]|nr:CDP-alcohol phosphatidyltransferase family protein [Gemmatimonadales bacterium]
MLANWITLSRLPLLLMIILIIYFGSPGLQLAGVVLLFIGVMLDTVDGVVARHRKETSLFGSVLDIAADRTYELVLWVVFAELGMISPAVPLIVIARTTITDAFRSIGVGKGVAPFAQHKTPLGRFLVGSPFMRTGYAVTKVTAFCGLALTRALAGMGEPIGTLLQIFQWVTWLAVFFCVFRGLPVIVRTLRDYWGIRGQALGTRDEG